MNTGRTLIIATVILAGCATQRYGRMPAVGETERTYLTCEQIEIEKGKARDFIREVGEHESKFTGKDVLSFLGDFGIGDDLEVNAAMKSATNRIVQLDELARAKGCSV